MTRYLSILLSTLVFIPALVMLSVPASADVPNNSVTSKKIVNGQVKSKDIKNDNVKSKDIKDNTLQRSDLSTDLLTTLTGSGLMVVDANGTEQMGLRLHEFETPEQFLDRLARVR